MKIQLRLNVNPYQTLKLPNSRKFQIPTSNIHDSGIFPMHAILGSVKHTRISILNERYFGSFPGHWPPNLLLQLKCIRALQTFKSPNITVQNIFPNEKSPRISQRKYSISIPFSHNSYIKWLYFVLSIHLAQS